LSVLFFSLSAEASRSNSFLVNSISISGTTKTLDRVVLNELTFKQGDVIQDEDLEESEERLLTLGIFVSSKIECESGNCLVNLQEKWTTIPIFKASSGGGVQHYTLGIYDPNLLGRYLETGAQIESLAGLLGGVVWFRDRRFLGKKMMLDLQQWKINRVRIKYDQDLDQPTETKAFIQDRSQTVVAIEPEWDQFKLRLGFEFHSDQFGRNGLDERYKRLFNGQSLPPATQVIQPILGIGFGQMKAKSWKLDGHTFHFEILPSFVVKGDEGNFVGSKAEYLGAKSLGDRWNLVQRFVAGTTTTNYLQYWNYLGGLDRIRGYRDNRFAGRHFLLSNSEVRPILFESSKFIIQGNAFLDLTTVGEETKDLGTLKGASAGAGLRLIVPKIYRLVLRLDYAKPLVREDDQNFSFGVQQFF